MYKTSKRKFGVFIREAREAQGISREELAQKLFVSEAAVWKWENGKRIPDFETLGNLSAELGVSMQDIYDHSKEEVTGVQVVEIVSIILIVSMLVGAIIFGLTHIRKTDNNSNKEVLGVGDKLTPGLRVKSVDLNAMGKKVANISYEYNSQGLMTKNETVTVADDSVYQIFYTYDEQGRLFEKIQRQLVNGNITHDDVFTYNYADPDYTCRVEVGSDGKVVGWYGIEEKNGLAVRTVEFDENGTLVREHVKDWINLADQPLYFRILCEQELDGYIRHNVVTEKGEIVEDSGYVTDENGRIVKFVVDKENPDLDIHYTYDEQGRVSEYGQSKITYTEDGFTVITDDGDREFIQYKVTIGEDRIEVREYDGLGALVRCEELNKNYQTVKSEWYNDQGNIYKSINTTYDEEGDIITEDEVWENGEAFHFTYDRVKIKNSQGENILEQRLADIDGEKNLSIILYHWEDIMRHVRLADDEVSGTHVSDIEYYENGLVKSYKDGDGMTYDFVYEDVLSTETD